MFSSGDEGLVQDILVIRLIDTDSVLVAAIVSRTTVQTGKSSSLRSRLGTSSSALPYMLLTVPSCPFVITSLSQTDVSI